MFSPRQVRLFLNKNVSEAVSETLSVSDEVYRESETVFNEVVKDIRLKYNNGGNEVQVSAGVSKINGALKLKVFGQCEVDISYTLYLFENDDAFNKRGKLNIPSDYASSEIDEKGINFFKITLVIYAVNGRLQDYSLYGNVHHEMNHIFKLFKRRKGFNYRFNMYPFASKKLLKYSENGGMKKKEEEKTLDERISDALMGLVYFAEQFEIDAEIQAVYRWFMYHKNKYVPIIEKNLQLVNNKKEYVENSIRQIFYQTMFYRSILQFKLNFDLINQNRKIADGVLKREYPKSKSSDNEKLENYVSNNLTIGTFLKYCQKQYHYVEKKVNNLFKRMYISFACTSILRDKLTFGVFGMSDNELGDFKKKYVS